MKCRSMQGWSKQAYCHHIVSTTSTSSLRPIDDTPLKHAGADHSTPPGTYRSVHHTSAPPPPCHITRFQSTSYGHSPNRNQIRVAYSLTCSTRNLGSKAELLSHVIQEMKEEATLILRYLWFSASLTSLISPPTSQPTRC